jgi:DNA polymerase III epsilon subunit-like protein
MQKRVCHPTLLSSLQQNPVVFTAPFVELSTEPSPLVTRKGNVLVFDVETTGLIPRLIPQVNKSSIMKIYPYILQLAFIVYNLEERKIIQTYNEYIRVPDNIFISPVINNITGITRELVNEKGTDIKNALIAFQEAYMISNTMVAHNIDFDKTMIEMEIQRNYENLPRATLCLFNPLFNKIHQKELYCTMKNGKKICNIYLTKDGKESKTLKSPKLSELYETLFHSIPENLHDALVDCNVCLKCFTEIMEK